MGDAVASAHCTSACRGLRAGAPLTRFPRGWRVLIVQAHRGPDIATGDGRGPQASLIDVPGVQLHLRAP
jgi:hypothetical protein